MTQLNPPVTTATGTLSKVYRKESMKKPRGIAKNFLKGTSRAEDQQDVAQIAGGGKQTSSPSRRDLAPPKGSTSNPNFGKSRGSVTGEGFAGGTVPGGGSAQGERVTSSPTKPSSRAQDQQLAGKKVPEGNQQTSAPSARDLPTGRGDTPVPNFIKDDQQQRQGTTETGPAGRPTAEAGGIGRAGGATQAGERFPRVERAEAGTGKNRTAGSAIQQAIDDGAADFNAQVKHRSQKIRDGRKRAVPKGHLSGD